MRLRFRSAWRRATLACAVCALPLRAIAATPPATPALRLETVAEGLENPVDLAAPPRDPRLFVVEQAGRIRVIRNGQLLATPFLDVRSRVQAGGERGLLSVAFHPRYSENGYFYVDYTDRHGDTRIERYHVSRDPDRADPASARLVLTIAQPYANHNGGLVMFGPDSMLYVGMGDGGSQGDPHGNGQNPAALLGKLLRLDVDHGDPYAIPRDNPFVGRPKFRPEIWALGLRNPWRFCFDRASGLILIADVGQNRWEEIDAVPWRRGGWNFGWNLEEGAHPYHDGAASVMPLTRPAWEYGHERGCSIIGGFVYRGRRIPALAGYYLYTDFCDGRLCGARVTESGVDPPREWNLHARGAISSFGEDASGEVYVTSFDGRVSRIAPGP